MQFLRIQVEVIIYVMKKDDYQQERLIRTDISDHLRERKVDQEVHYPILITSIAFEKSTTYPIYLGVIKKT